MFGLRWKKRYNDLFQEHKVLLDLKERLLEANADLSNKVVDYCLKYPFDLGQVVYDVQLRNTQGRYTKNKASRAHSVINEVIVDTKNYFKLVDRLHSHDVFLSNNAAEEYLDSICIE